MEKFAENSRISIPKVLFFVLVSLVIGQTTSATHLDGGSISYTRIAGSTYSLRLLVYEDCSSMPQTPFLANTTEQTLFVRNKCGSVPVAVPVIRTVYPAVQVPNKCQQLPSICTGGTIKGIRYVVFEGTYTFPQVNSNASLCNEWDITYGATSALGRCCRAFGNNLSGIPGGPVNNSNTSFFLQAYLNNNQDVGNSSGQLALYTTPFFCSMLSTLNVEHGEPDGDSLAYALVPVLTGYQTPANYATGLSATQPLQGVAAGIQIDQSNGNISFVSSVTQIAAIGIERKEFRNGLLVGATTLVTNVMISAGAYCGILWDTVFLSGCDSLLLPNGQMAYADGAYNDTILAVNACDTITTYSYRVTSQPIQPVINGQGWAIPGSVTNFQVSNQLAGLTYAWKVVGGTALPAFGHETAVTWGAIGQGEVTLYAYEDSTCQVATQMLVEVAGGVGVYEPELLQPKLAPNPAQEQLHLSRLQGVESVVLQDQHGKRLASWPVFESEMTLDLSDFSEGLYLLGFQSPKGMRFEKLVILR
jgi:hypothetical protein